MHVRVNVYQICVSACRDGVRSCSDRSGRCVVSTRLRKGNIWNIGRKGNINFHSIVRYISKVDLL